MRKILVVDDERHIVRLIQVNLERQGYNVVWRTMAKRRWRRSHPKSPTWWCWM